MIFSKRESGQLHLVSILSMMIRANLGQCNKNGKGKLGAKAQPKSEESVETNKIGEEDGP